MILTDVTQVASETLPIAGFKDHLRLGTGFADDGLQDEVLEAILRAAIAAIEGRCGKVLIARDMAMSLPAWRDLGAQAFPVAPVTAITALSILDRFGAEEVIDPDRYRLEPDTHRPRLVAAGLLLPAIPVGGSAEIAFTAGFGPAWGDVPADLQRAVLLLGARLYEDRSGEATALPPAVEALIGRHRGLRLFGGRT